MRAFGTTPIQTARLVGQLQESIFHSYSLPSCNTICYNALMRVLLGALLALQTATQPVAAQEEELWREDVRVTFYTIRGTMRWGNYTYLGAAACGSYFPAGTKLRFVQDDFTVVCEDTGYLGRYHIDVWAPSYAWGRRYIAGDYGDYATVSVLRWGW